MEAAIQITQGLRFDVELAKISIKLEWLVNALEANGDSPAAEILGGITKELDNLVEPIAEMQEVRHG